MSKEEIINKLTLLDTSHYRIVKHNSSGVYEKEPKSYRLKLALVYNKLSVKSLNELLFLKKVNP